MNFFCRDNLHGGFSLFLEFIINRRGLAAALYSTFRIYLPHRRTSKLPEEISTFGASMLPFDLSGRSPMALSCDINNLRLSDSGEPRDAKQARQSADIGHHNAAI
jgi:hypothetical protein